MLRFNQPTRTSPRNYLVRKEQYRLLALVAILGLVAVLASQIQSPQGRAALSLFFGEQQPAVAAVSVGQPLADPDPKQWMTADQRESIRDNMVFRNAESEAWFGVIEQLQQTPPGDYTAVALPVGYTQLARQGPAYRGRTVRVAGEIMRIEPQTPAENQLGIEQYYRVIFRPAGDEVWPIAAYCLELPEGVTPGDQLALPAVAVGVFFKNQSYQSQAGAGVMPVVLCRTVGLTVPLAAFEPEETTPMKASDMLTMVAIAAGIAAVLVTFFVRAGGK